VGLAFIHAFDFAKGEVIIHTPLRRPALDEVDAMLRGDISWEPHSAPKQRAAAHSSSGLWQPYFCPWSLEEMGAGTRVLSTRGNLLRKRLQKKGLKKGEAS
jgi:hypothetical protein